jgi:hypothetical protein
MSPAEMICPASSRTRRSVTGRVLGEIGEALQGDGWYGNEGATKAGWWTSPHALSAHSQSIGPERFAAERGATS